VAKRLRSSRRRDYLKHIASTSSVVPTIKFRSSRARLEGTVDRRTASTPAAPLARLNVAMARPRRGGPAYAASLQQTLPPPMGQSDPSRRCKATESIPTWAERPGDSEPGRPEAARFRRTEGIGAATSRTDVRPHYATDPNGTPTMVKPDRGDVQTRRRQDQVDRQGAGRHSWRQVMTACSTMWKIGVPRLHPCLLRHASLPGLTAQATIRNAAAREVGGAEDELGV